MKFKQYLCGSIAVLGLLAGTGAASAKDHWIISKFGETDANGMTPRFAVIQRPQPLSATRRALTLAPTWTYSFTYKQIVYNESFIGTVPSGDASTTVPVYIIPLKFTSGTFTTDPTVDQSNGVSIIQNVLNSPLFQSSIDYVQGHIDLGKTQYEDAFQRATLFAAGAIQPGYHVLLGTPTVEPLQSFKLTAAQGAVATTNAGVKILLADATFVDAKIQALIKTLKIPSNALPLFVTDATYMTSGAPTTNDCCIGGWHSITAAGQPYSISTYIATPGMFSQNISAMSHELGEWMDDPFTNNPVPPKCGQGAILEVGDPLEGDKDFGDHAYKVNGVTWDPQDLVLLPYFGAPASLSVNSWHTFQGKSIAFCSKGG